MIRHFLSSNWKRLGGRESYMESLLHSKIFNKIQRSHHFRGTCSIHSQTIYWY